MGDLAKQVLGLTLDEYAAALGRHRQAVRAEYVAIMRGGAELPEPTRVDESGGTIKFCLPVDGEAGGKRLETESVIIPMESFRGTRWYTLCVSSQVGCRMGCTFCETGRMGLIRNLTAAEIVTQRMAARRLLEARTMTAATTETRRHEVDEGPRRKLGEGRQSVRGAKYHSDGIQNIVFMGMGEPLDNFENLVQAIRVLNEPAGLDFPLGQITVSTVGRVDGLRRLGALGWPNLRVAISLNAATDQVRSEIMPVNKAMPLADLKRTLLEYPLGRKGRFLIEYVLIKGVNDSLADAEAVVEFCQGLPCIVNLIPYNPQRFAAYETSGEEAIMAFLMHLKGRGVFVKRRVTHGRDLMGACGQLGNPEVRRVKVTVAGRE